MNITNGNRDILPSSLSLVCCFFLSLTCMDISIFSSIDLKIGFRKTKIPGVLPCLNRSGVMRHLYWTFCFRLTLYILIRAKKYMQ